MNNKEAIFLETSLQILRHFHHPDIRAKAQQIINNFPMKLSSTYVRMEYFYSIIQDLVYLYDLSKRLTNIGEIHYRIEKLPNIQRRKLNRTLECLATFFYDAGTDTSDISIKLQSWLRQTIDDAFDCFNESVDFIYDETGCAKARMPLQKNGDTYLPFGRCKVANKQCKIDEFFQNHLQEFHSLFEALQKMPQQEKDEELIRMEKILERAIKYPQNMLDYQNCRKCGDTIISIECPSKAILFTLNTEHYKIINSVIGRRLIEPSAELKKIDGPM